MHQLVFPLVGGGLFVLLFIAAGCSTSEHARLAKLGLITPANHQLSFTFGRKIGDEEVIAAMPDLQRVHAQELRLPSLQVTDRIIPAVTKVESLEVLDLSGTDVTIDGLCQLRSLPHLKTLWISLEYYSSAELASLKSILSGTEVLEGNLGTRWRESSENPKILRPR